MNQSAFVEESLNQTCTSVFRQHQFTIIAIVNMVMGIVSFTISCFTLLLIIVLRKWKFFSQRLILYLVIATLLGATAIMINRVDFSDEPSSDFFRGFCTFTGFFSQVTTWMVLNSISSITFYIFIRVIINKNTEKYEWVYIISTFALPLLFNWIPFINASYGRAGPWCWIKSFDIRTCELLIFGQWLQFGLLYIPLYCLLFALTIMYVIILAKICYKRRALAGTDNPDAKRVVRKMMNEIGSLIVYPMIYFILSFPLLVNRIYSSFNPTEPSLVLWYMSAITLPLQGACTGTIFIFTTICRRTTWAELRSQTKIKSRIEATQHKITIYPMRANEASDSAAFTERRLYDTIDYEEYQP